MSGKHRAIEVTPRSVLREIVSISSKFPHVARNYLWGNRRRNQWESWGAPSFSYPTAIEAEAHDGLEDYVWLLGGAK